MAFYTHKDKISLAYDANVKRIRAGAAIVVQSVLNEVLNEMTSQFKQALTAGEILHFSGDEDEVRGLLLSALGVKAKRNAHRE